MHLKIYEFLLQYINCNISAVQITIIGILWFIFIIQVYFERRQYNLIQDTNKYEHVEDLNETLSKINYSTLFNLEKLQYSMLSSIYAVVLSTVEIYFGFYYKYWLISGRLSPVCNELIQNITWFHILYTIYCIFDTPYSIYENSLKNNNCHILNKNSNKNRPFFFNGNFFSYVMVQWLGICFCIVYNILMKNCHRNHLYLCVWIVLLLIYLTCYNFCTPAISRTFNTYILLPNCELRLEIEALTRKLSFPLNNIYIIEATNWFGYKNLEMIGVTSEKNIVINELLLQRRKELLFSNFENDVDKNSSRSLENEEILALIVQELGHWYYGHFYKLFVVLIAYFLIMFILFGLTFQRDLILMAFGFPENVKPVLASLFAILSYIITPYNILANFFINIYCQTLEYKADKFCYESGYGNQLKSALVKIYSDKIIFPNMDPWYSRWKLDQPTLPERLKVLEGLEHNLKTEMHVLLNKQISKNLEDSKEKSETVANTHNKNTEPIIESKVEENITQQSDVNKSKSNEINKVEDSLKEEDNQIKKECTCTSVVIYTGNPNTLPVVNKLSKYKMKSHEKIQPKETFSHIPIRELRKYKWTYDNTLPSRLAPIKKYNYSRLAKINPTSYLKPVENNTNNEIEKENVSCIRPKSSHLSTRFYNDVSYGNMKRPCTGLAVRRNNNCNSCIPIRQNSFRHSDLHLFNNKYPFNKIKYLNP